MTPLVLCRACTRHFRPHEPACPFCGAVAAKTAARSESNSLWAGASRSRRYAASAAFIASSASFSCGQTASTTGESGGAGNGGDTQSNAGSPSGGIDGRGGDSKGGTGSRGSGGAGAQAGTSGGAGGVTQTAGRAGAAGKAGTAGSSGSAGAHTVTGTRACTPALEREGCRTNADCPMAIESTGSYCAMTGPTRGCGNPAFIPKCPVPCPDGQTCATTSSCGAEQCVPTCDEQNCTGFSHCVDGTCTAKPCDAGGAECTPDYQCDSTATIGNHCVPIECTAGYDCESWKACAPDAVSRDVHGCATVACTADEDCGKCGYCVQGQCEPTLGLCYMPLPAMPYGCVWPDEELV